MGDLGQADLRNPWHPHLPCTCLYGKCERLRVCVSVAGMCQGIKGLKERRLNVVRVLRTTVEISDFISASRIEWNLESESSMETLESQ